MSKFLINHEKISQNSDLIPSLSQSGDKAYKPCIETWYTLQQFPRLLQAWTKNKMPWHCSFMDALSIHIFRFSCTCVKQICAMKQHATSQIIQSISSFKKSLWLRNTNSINQTILDLKGSSHFHVQFIPPWLHILMVYEMCQYPIVLRHGNKPLPVPP